MKERPILFSSAMIRAILEGRKTQTRRAVNPQPTQDVHLPNGEVVSEAPYWTWRPRGKKGKCLGTTKKILKEVILSMCPYGSPEDRLWVKERHQIYGHWRKNGLTKKTRKQAWKFVAHHSHKVLYDGAFEPHPKRRELLGYWTRPSIFMPRWASRIDLGNKHVGVERLKDISEADAIAEGSTNIPGYAVMEYADLWDSINGKKHPWKSNPFCWVIEFKKL